MVLCSPSGIWRWISGRTDFTRSITSSTLASGAVLMPMNTEVLPLKATFVL